MSDLMSMPRREVWDELDKTIPETYLKSERNRNPQFYFDIYIRATRGEPNFLEMEVV